MFNTAVRTLLPCLEHTCMLQSDSPLQAASPEIWTGSKPPNSLSLSTPFSKIIFQWVFPKSWANSSSCILPWPGASCPSLPPGSLYLCQTNEHVFICPGTLRFLLQTQICRVLQITVFFLRLPLQDHFSLTSTSLLLILYSYLLLVLLPIMHCELIHDVNDTFC